MRVLHHVQVACPLGGEEAVREFYGRLLGLDEVDKPPELAKRGGAWFRGDGYELHVGVEAAVRAGPQGASGVPRRRPRRPGGSACRAGYDVSWDSNFPGYRRFHVADPHGNRVEILGG